MKKHSQRLPIGMLKFLQGALMAVMAVAFLALPVASNAQEISTTVRGTVLTPDGAPAAGISVSVTDTRTGAVRRVTTNNNGGFNVRGLPVGGPYEIRVQSAQYQDALVTDVYTNLSAAASFSITLGAATEEIEEIVTTARMVATAELAIGPGTSFNLDDIESLPSIARQIRDVIRSDPRVSLARADNGAGYGINCLGGNSRSNVTTIDGAIANDGFGLNEGTGTAARFAFPIPYDVIASASVEFAPLDVQYGQFKSCAINIVTKPGSNEYHGSAFYLVNNENLTGDKLDGDKLSTDPFEDTNWGFNFGGPIIKDTLFFQVGYEETDEGGSQNTGPTGGGFANELSFITVDEANAIRTILLNQYDRDPGYIVRTLPQTSERKFARLDWHINDDHRAELSYAKLDELNLDPDDCCGSFDGFTFSDNFELEGIEMDTVSVRVFSDWTDNFSTEFRYSTYDVTDIQGPVGGGEAQDPNPIPRIQVEEGGNPILTSGPGFFRSANDLQYTIDQIKLAADLVVGDHTLTFGFEQESRDVFNLFIPDATGTIVFASVDDLQTGLADSIVMNGSYTQDPNDAAASFKRDINSFYLQDQWQVNDSLIVVAGVRFEQYQSSDKPVFNPVFEQRYGFTNTQTFDGLDLVMPRIGLTWDLPSSKWGETQLTAGFGVFGGQDPTVHFANSYQNFGGAIGFGGSFSSACDSDPDVLQVLDGSGNFTGIPACVRQAAADQANANLASVAAVDPNFDLPSNERWHLGLNHFMKSGNGFLNDWQVRLEYIYTKHKDAPNWIDLTETPNGVILPDGRPQFFGIDPLLPGCDATFNGIGQGFSGSEVFPGGACDDESNENQDILMTNGPEGHTGVMSLILNKEFEISDKTSFNMSLGYAYTDSKTGNPVNSSTATSSYEEVAVEVPNQVRLAPNLWANKHNITLQGRLRHYFLENNPTTFSFFFNRRSGRPFSYAYEDDTGEEYFGDSDDEARILMYIPTGPTDPIMDFSNLSDSSRDGLFAFLDASGLSKYAGGIAPRNAFYAPWSSDLDIRIKQSIPMWGEHSLDVFLDIENVLNLFSDSDNIKRYPDTDDVQEAARLMEINERDSAAINNFDQFVITRWYNEGFDWNRDVDDSVYRIQLGVQYRF